jgi:hypothetical protein
MNGWAHGWWSRSELSKIGREPGVPRRWGTTACLAYTLRLKGPGRLQLPSDISATAQLKEAFLNAN